MCWQSTLLSQHSSINHKCLLLSPADTLGSGKLQVELNVNQRDGHGETPLSLALWSQQFIIAKQLLGAGADQESTDTEDPGLLYRAILREQQKAALFLLENGANYKQR